MKITVNLEDCIDLDPEEQNLLRGLKFLESVEIEIDSFLELIIKQGWQNQSIFSKIYKKYAKDNPTVKAKFLKVPTLPYEISQDLIKKATIKQIEENLPFLDGLIWTARDLVRELVERTKNRTILGKVYAELLKDPQALQLRASVVAKYPKIGLTDPNPYIRAIARDTAIIDQDLSEVAAEKMFLFLRDKYPKWILNKRERDSNFQVYSGNVHFYLQSEKLDSFTLRFLINTKRKTSITHPNKSSELFLHKKNIVNVLRGKMVCTFASWEDDLQWFIDKWNRIYIT